MPLTWVVREMPWGTRCQGDFWRMSGITSWLTSSLEGLSRDETELDLLVSRKEELLEKVVIRDNLVCSDHVVVKVKMLGRVKIREQQRTDLRLQKKKETLAFVQEKIQ